MLCKTQTTNSKNNNKCNGYVNKKAVFNKYIFYLYYFSYIFFFDSCKCVYKFFPLYS